ncbi:MAG: tetratricopeptide repeat protein, partial [Acidobacteriota bacterium]
VPESGIKEMDLSQDFGDFFGGAAEAPVETEAVTEPEVFNPSQAEEEIQFYLGQQLFAEARQELETLEQKFPGNSEVAALRDKTEEFISKAEAEAATPPAEVAAEAPVEVVLEQEAPAEPSLAPAQAEATPEPEAARPAEAGEGTGFLEQLAGEVEAGLKGVADAASASEVGAKAPAAQAAPAASSAAAEAPAGPLSDLLEELELGEEEPVSKADAETHYNLGIAFREMGLLDEAISEFQKVVQNVAKNATEVPPNFLQSCHLLALCFMEKEMPRVAVKWYQRALEIHKLESETILALYYDLGLAYEQGSDIPAALESFTEVYSQNIDYRDVAERIQSLQKKSS